MQFHICAKLLLKDFCMLHSATENAEVDVSHADIRLIDRRHKISLSLHFSFAEDPCSAEFRPLELTGESGSFTSANYPANYDNNADCQWRITGVGTNAVRLFTV